MNKFGGTLRESRESQGLLLRQVAAQLETDTAHISKLERGERRVKREQVIRLAILFNTNSKGLLIIKLFHRFLPRYSLLKKGNGLVTEVWLKSAFSCFFPFRKPIQTNMLYTGYQCDVIKFY